jgi:hypothetical protein
MAGCPTPRPVSAQIERLERQLVALAAENGGRVPLVSDVRFFPYSCASRRLVLACAERSDGAADVQVLFETALPIDPDNFDEDAMREMFLDVPSGRKALGFPSVSRVVTSPKPESIKTSDGNCCAYQPNDHFIKGRSSGWSGRIGGHDRCLSCAELDTPCRQHWLDTCSPVKR